MGPPWYQPFVDILKLLGKETLVPEGAKKTTFLLSPLIGLTGVTLASTVLLVINFGLRQGFVGDLIVIIYLFAFTPLAIILAGSASNNPFGSVGANREMTLYFGYELPLLIAIFSVVVKSGGLIQISELISFQGASGPFLYSISGVIAFVVSLLCIQAKLAYAPFDIPEAETEVQTGPFIEYSGPPLAVFKLTKAMMLFLLPVFLITLFWGGLTSWSAVLKYVLILVLIILIKNVNPRVRIDQAMRFFWIPMVILSAIGMIFAYYGHWRER
jgi:Formate hydrogenlyase subunit 4